MAHAFLATVLRNMSHIVHLYIHKTHMGNQQQLLITINNMGNQQLIIDNQLVHIYE